MFNACIGERNEQHKEAVSLMVALMILSLLVVPHSTVKAQSQTIIVPYDYPTISSAIGNATNGDTILVKNGNYQEHS